MIVSAFADEIAPQLGIQVAVLQRHGIDHVDLRAVEGGNVIELDDAQAGMVRDELRRHGLSVATIASPIGKEPSDVDPDDLLRRMSRAARVAHLLGTDLVRVFGFHPPGDGGEGPLRSLRLLASCAREAGVTLLLENEVGTAADSIEHTTELLASLADDQVRAAFDPANALRCGDRPYPDGYARVRPWLRQVHVKDLDENGRVVPAGAGVADWAGLIGALRRDGYGGLISLEPHLLRAGRSGGFTGPALFGEAHRALQALMTSDGTRSARIPAQGDAVHTQLAPTTTTPLNLADYETLAHERLDRATWDYFAEGSGDEVTLRANRAAFERLRLRPRVVAEEGPVRTSTTALGAPIELPVLVAPTAYHGLVHPEAESATAIGAGDAGTIMVVSINSNRTLEDVAAAATGPLWLQLYLTGDHAADEEIVIRAEDAGYAALVLTVDRPVYGARERDLRNGFRLPDNLRCANYDGTRDLRARAWTSWAAVDWLLETTKLPVGVKGILAAEDALIAVERGVAAVLVSNHGGRQLDGALAGIEALPGVASAVADRCEVFCDGGVRRGGDVLKSVALGARAVLVGRPVVWGLTVDGAAGVTAVLRMLGDELERDLTLCGRQRVSDLDRSLVTSIPEPA